MGWGKRRDQWTLSKMQEAELVILNLDKCW